MNDTMERKRFSTRLAELPDMSSPPMLIAAVAVILAFTGLGVVVLTAAGARPAVDLQTEVRHGQVSAWMESTEWLVHDHGQHDHTEDEAELGPDASAAAANELPVNGTGFSMPGAMMPGTPDEGFRRLQVEMSFLNNGGPDVEPNPVEFTLAGAGGEEYPALLGGTFVPSALAEGHFLNTVVAFDVPEEAIDPTMYLVWRSDGETTRFAVPTEGSHH